MVGPVSQALYSETPDFNVYSVKRLIYTLTDLLPALGVASTVKLLKGTILFTSREKRHSSKKSESRN